MESENIRKAVLTDLQLLFEWTNDELVRENSFCSSKINFDTHKKWFNKKLKSRTGDIFIYEVDTKPVGQLRLDYEEDKVIIGYTIQRDLRGRGYGTRVLSLAEEMARKRYLQQQGTSYVTLIGRVKYSNEVSRRRFDRLGYQGEELEHYIEYHKKIMIGKMIPYGHQSIDEDDIKAVVETMQSDYLTTGPKIVEFEKVFAEYVHAKYAVAVSNGTAALHLACMAAGVKKGDEVITSPVTFAASANCILYCGGTPVFADIDATTYNIDPRDIENKITENTKAIIAVHFTGQPCEMDCIHKIAKKNNLLVIEDAAHALGADYKGQMVGSMSDMTTFSFHPVKHITTAEGGMITTNSKELYEKLIRYRSHGITRDPKLLLREEGSWYYEQLELGYNYRLTDIQCALGISQLRKLENYIQRRREIATRYDEAFKKEPNIIIPKQQKGCHNSYHLYVIQVRNQERAKVIKRLQAEGIGANVHYIPVYKHPYYMEQGYSNVICKNAEEYYKNCISLPIYPGLTMNDQEYVIERVQWIVKFQCQ